MKRFLYRTLDTDEDGEAPLDHGVVLAHSIKDTPRLLREHFIDLGLFGPTDSLVVRLYELRPFTDPGVVETVHPSVDITVSY